MPTTILIEVFSLVEVFILITALVNAGVKNIRY